jgi:hypothetical protein
VKPLRWTLSGELETSRLRGLGSVNVQVEGGTLGVRKLNSASLRAIYLGFALASSFAATPAAGFAAELSFWRVR